MIERQRDLFASALEERFAVDERESAFPAALREFYRKMHNNRDALLALLDVRTERYLLRDELETVLKGAYCKRFADDEALGIDEMTLDFLSDAFAATALSSVRWFLEVDDKRARHHRERRTAAQRQPRLRLHGLCPPVRQLENAPNQGSTPRKLQLT